MLSIILKNNNLIQDKRNLVYFNYYLLIFFNFYRQYFFKKFKNVSYLYLFFISNFK